MATDDHQHENAKHNGLIHYVLNQSKLGHVLIVGKQRVSKSLVYSNILGERVRMTQRQNDTVRHFGTVCHFDTEGHFGTATK